MIDLSSNPFTFFELGEIPLVNNLNLTYEESINCERYPLSVNLYENGLVKLSKIIDSKLLFNKYLYISGTSLPFVKHCDDMCNHLKKIIQIDENDTIVDIGGNDGTLLDTFRKNLKKSLKLINIDPSDISIISTQKDIECINEYFNKQSIDKIKSKVKLLITTNVFQHLENIEDFVKNIELLLDDDSIWCLEFPYWFKSMETLQFDQIYHEHIYYYNISPLNELFYRHGLKIVNVTEQEIHGGSLRLIISKDTSKYKSDKTIEHFILQEENINVEYYKNWSDKVNRHLDNCLFEIKKLSRNYEIIGFGAAAKGTVFLNYLKIKNDLISYVIDDTIIKQGRYIPGTGLKIFSREKILEKQPDYILILAHNFKDYIIHSLREYGYKNKFIVCIPEFKIID